MAEAKWSVLVDWNADGDYTDANEDITDDVLDLKHDHRRNLRTERVEPAKLTLVVKNDGHKYSPPNGSSPLSGNLIPGRKVWVRAAYPYDSFTGAADTALSAHTPDQDSNYPWTDNIRTFELDGSGAARLDPTGTLDAVATIDFSHADGSFGCNFTRGTDPTDHGGLTFRLSNTTNYLYVRVTGTAIEVRKVDTGSDSIVASAAHTWATSTTKFLQVVLHGTSILVFVNDKKIIDTVSSFNTTATNHGLFADDDNDHAWDDFGGWVSLFTGAIEDITPSPLTSEQTCEIVACDEMERLRRVTLYWYSTSPLPQTTDEIVDDLLDYADVATAARQLDTGVALVPELYSPPLWGITALAGLRMAQAEEDGFLRIDGHGHWHLEARGHKTSAPHTTSQATLKDTDDGTNPVFADLEWDDGIAFVENTEYMRIRSATTSGLVVAWTLGEVVQQDASETKDYIAESEDYDIVAGQLTPAATTDYVANTQADGGGTDITGELTVTHPLTADYNGKGTLIRVVFGATAGYLTKLQLRTLNGFIFDDFVLVRDLDTASQATYGEQDHTIRAQWTREVDVALATIANRLARRKDPLTALEVQLRNSTKATLFHLLQRQLSDRLTVSYSDMGISEDFWLQGHTLRVTEGGTIVTRDLLLQGV